MKKLAGVLAGSGFLDGSEIQEVVMTLLAFERLGVELEWFAPDREQAHVVDHLRAAPIKESRNVLQESARMVRGAISPLNRLDPADFDGLVLPGGFGAAKNLCSFAFEGAGMQVLQELAIRVTGFHKQNKPLGLICIAPVIAAKVLGEAGHQPLVTIGTHQETAAAITSWGARHEECGPEAICCDPRNLLVSTPAWNAAERATQVEVGINNLATKLNSMLEGD